MGIRSQTLTEFFKFNLEELEEYSIAVVELSLGSALITLDEFDTQILLSKSGEFFVASSLLRKIKTSKHIPSILTNLLKLHGLNLGVRTFLTDDSQIGIIADDFSHDFNAVELCTWLYQFQFIANIALSIVSISNTSGEILTQSAIETLFDEPN